ncbi:DUF2806 domain-containing protein [Citrobacter freundii]|uniref:DUF2806 domain-containing protein n=1 Tax=Citrobacter freundii TaxID=546 RepID=A0AAP5XUZ2_CITFR|nr:MULTISPECIES: DUF2806 domain-containing protein [Citrobacter]AYL55901.1 DUF2806 domain-containing protein [Citrobacter freundii]EGT0637348.1 DUF2806 domain-containing protein [Citrobacter freundii]EJC6093782.1 DUF2806 domain-containing protein [Citrobacter freundii]EKV1034152.1 DUF2806 domain-containing protein [Citrobacter freundii]EKW5569985.1 DUF2806 domain-containing protein [Citrobacter freundii]
MSLIDLSLSGLSEPGTKLIEKVSDAIGVLYEPTRIRKKAKAEAEAKRTELISKLELEGIEKRAVERFLKRETKRQENIENITMQAAQSLSETDNVSDIDEDWIEAFFRECEDINDEQMQMLWGRILSEEAKSKGSFSRRTLKLLSTLSKEEANLITYFGKFVWQASNLTPILLTDENGNTEGITFNELSVLDSLGVIQQGIGYSLTFGNKKGRIGYYGMAFLVEFQSDDSSTWNLQIGTALLTPIGQELMKICGSTPDIAYVHKFLNKTNVEGSQVKLSILTM